MRRRKASRRRTPDLTAERARLEERRAALDGALKQTRLLMLRADNISVRITERRRALFTQELLGRTSSALDPAFWTQAFKAAPDAWFGVKLLAQGWMDHLRASATPGSWARRVLALLVFFVCAALFLRWFVRARLPAERAWHPLRQVVLRAAVAAARHHHGAGVVVGGAVLILERVRPADRADRQYRPDARDRGHDCGLRPWGRVGLFAPGDPDRRLLSVQGGDRRAGRVATDLGRPHSRRGHL